MPIKITPKNQAKINIVRKKDSEENTAQRQEVQKEENSLVEKVEVPKEERKIEMPKERKVIEIFPQKKAIEEKGLEELETIEFEEEELELEESLEFIEIEEREKSASRISINAQRAPIISVSQDLIEEATMEELLQDLANKWEEFTAKPRAKLCRLIIEAQEIVFLEQFLLLENGSKKNTKDFFIKFTSTFENSVQYSESLIEELKTQIKSGLSFDEKVLYGFWEEWKSPSLLQGPEYFSQNLSLFFSEIFKDTEKKIVAYIAPEEVKDNNDWMHWIGRVLETKMPDNVYLMMTDPVDKPLQEDLVKAFPIRLFSLKANLNIAGFFKGLNESIGEEQPDEFRDLMTQLVQAAPTENTTIARIEERLVEITEEKGWPHLRICVHNIVGQKLLEINYNEAAYKKHAQAREIAADLEDYEKRGALAEGLTAESLKGLLPDSIFAQAMVCYEIKEYELAGMHFEEAANHHRFTKGYLQEILSRQFGGLSYQRSKQLEKAWDIYNEALEAGVFLEEEQRQESPLAYIGNELIKLTEPLGLNNSRVLVRQRMIELLGAEWEDYIPEYANE